MHIALLLSGGVDSSVALHELCAAGHTVTAFYLKIWLDDELSFLGECPWEDDLSYARTVCEHYGVPLEVVPLQRAYWDRVVSTIIEEIKAGRTPNPDILCNQRVKFGAFYDAIGHAFDGIASGHYARVFHDESGVAHLYAAPDAIKDQTYFLSGMSQEQLYRAYFPIGHMNKAQVREKAAEIGVPNMHRKDSQGVCFLGKIKFRDFVAHHLGEQSGDLIEYETGMRVGSHKGFWFYTIGQRQGLGLAGGPWYVVDKDTDHNVVFISRTYYAVDKKRNHIVINEPHWLTGNSPLTDNSLSCEVKLRHGPDRHPCTLTKTENGNIRVSLVDRDQGIAPGQYAVFYAGDECLGSAIIKEGVA